MREGGGSSYSESQTEGGDSGASSLGSETLCSKAGFTERNRPPTAASGGESGPSVQALGSSSAPACAGWGTRPFTGASGGRRLISSRFGRAMRDGPPPPGRLR